MWWLIAAAMAGDACEHVKLGDIVDVSAPAVVVLGERYGHQPDLSRAHKVVAKLRKRGDVTVAVGSVQARHQPLLDGFASGRLDASDLPGLMDWDNTWGFSWKAYEPLVTAGSRGDHVVGIGVPYGPRPADASMPIPPRYVDVLRAGMGGHEVSPGTAAQLVQAMAWRDFRMAQLAVEGWDQDGFLVVVVGRGQVEGGKGVAWQLARMTRAPVHAAVLAAGDDPPCYAGDRLWR
jgi:hypothetical protein